MQFLQNMFLECYYLTLFDYVDFVIYDKKILHFFRGLRKTQIKKSTEKKFDLLHYFKVNMATDSHMQNAPKKPSPNKNDSPHQESYWNQKNLPQNVDNSSKSYIHGVERSRESSRSVEHLHETPPKRSEKRSREESSGKSSEKFQDEKRSKQSHHSHSRSPKREGSRMRHSPASFEYSNESFQKMSENRSREESRGKSSERSRNEKSSKQGHHSCLLYTSPSPRDLSTSRMPSSA